MAFDNTIAEKDIVEKLGQLKRDLLVLSDAIDAVRYETAENAVKRNSAISMLAFKSHDDVKKQLPSVVCDNALPDEMVRRRLQSLGVDAYAFSEATGVIAEAFADLTQEWAFHSRKLRDQMVASQTRVVELSERLREHALHNAEVREAVWAITGGKCFYCDVELIRCAGEEQDRSRCFHVDHIVPKSLGGPDHLSNYVPACERCNFSKGPKHFVEFLAWRKAQQAPPQLVVIEGGAVA